MNEPGATPPPARRNDFADQDSADIAKLDELRAESLRRVRRLPTVEEMARRQSRLKLARWGLPSLAAFILVSLAAWPEIAHLVNLNRKALHDMQRFQHLTGAIENAIYRDSDSKDRPYTLTSRNARQIGKNRIDLEQPVADILMKNNVWLNVKADHGVYMRDQQTLTLTGHVVLYRNDGILLNSPTADMDLKRNIVATASWVHAEGPFGTQDAEGAFLDQNAGTIQFTGPGLTVHNDDKDPLSSSSPAGKGT
ncbi:LPS export ABC transporter periplasmic protein LptC [Acetobacteraceae bacterium ESL0709]|nr:LPS export ABC transporter periplasmic protein LptC [Acetobacteraceae bacterium ESL0697]MDF7677770.1 LPS export ABC transporter periplasmic protein LptC [Acetobacteraceae bacterium ESL0709]